MVWPYAMGKVRGLALEPLHPMVPKAALADPELWQCLALVDALRSNDGVRVSQLAEKLLGESIAIAAMARRSRTESQSA